MGLKNTKHLLFILLLASSVSAQSMRVDSTVHRVMYRMGLTTAGDDLTTQAKIKMALNGALSEVCFDFPAIEDTGTILLCRDSVVGSFISARVAQVNHVKKRVNGLWIPMAPMSPDKINEALGGTLSKTTYDPTDTLQPRYWWSYGRRLEVYTSVTKECSDPDTVVVSFRAYDRQLTNDTNTIGIERGYMPLLELKLLEIASQQRLNYADAAWFRSMYDSRKPPIDRTAELKR